MIIKNNDTVLKVPAGIRFLLDWNDFKFYKFPAKFILDKQIPGCGFTEYCLNGIEDIILCSPRKMLLENKYGQHEKDVYLVVNEMDPDLNIDKDLSNKVVRSRVTMKLKQEDPKENPYTKVYSRLYREISDYCYERGKNGLPRKILVTYDSYRIVQDILINLGQFGTFYTVVDEFQSILHDSRFKSSTELEFLDYLHKSHSVIFASATPMMDEYLNMLDEFDGLPFFTLDWGSEDLNRIMKPYIRPLTMKSVGTKAEEIIQTYLNGDFEKTVVMRSGKPVEVVSDEAVFYVNSVNHIISIIKKSELNPEQCNILCSNTEENKKKIRRKLGKGFIIGKVPKKYEKPKMFTFCTRTVYLGADFYSTCARTFIFSDSNIDSLAVDISEDLPQILGRQRLEENPWKNKANFYYRTTCDFRKIPQEVFDKEIERKRKATEDLLSVYQKGTGSEKSSLAITYEDNVKAYNYKNNYVAVNTHGGLHMQPVLNNLVLVSEIRAFKIQQYDYADRCTLFTTMNNKLTPDDISNKRVSKFIEEYDSKKTYYEKMKLLCECSLSNDEIEMFLYQIPDSDPIKSHYLALGPQRLKALGYNSTKANKELGIIMFSPELLLDSIYSSFKEGEKYTLSDLKIRLGNIYSSINYLSTPKANDIERWFGIKEYMITQEIDGKRKRVRGYELIKSKEQELRQELKYAN